MKTAYNISPHCKSKHNNKSMQVKDTFGTEQLMTINARIYESELYHPEWSLSRVHRDMGMCIHGHPLFLE